MSKIQDALHKIQADQKGPGPHAVAKKKKPTAAGTSQRAKISDVADVESSHNVIIDVDQNALREIGLLAPVQYEKLLANQYRDIKRPLIASAFGRRAVKVEDGSLIMVTSALPGEGKTFTSLNLALSIAREQDLSVVLVDADVAKPHLGEVFGLSEMRGLLDLLEGAVQSAESMIVPSNIDGFSILPAGVPREHASELLSGSRMDEVVRQLQGRDSQRLIVFDTPPLLRTSESKAILGIAGQVVLVVKAESTTQGMVASALSILGSQKAVNLVLNQVRSGGTGIDCEYSTSYGYGLGEATPAESSQGSIF